MKPGARVTTPKGTGTLMRIVVDERWAFRRPVPFPWMHVRLDGQTREQPFLPSEVQEATMSEPTTIETEEEIPFVTEDDPADDESSSTDADTSTDEEGEPEPVDEP